MPQLPAVNCKYGAPMGRHSYGLIQNCEDRTVRLFRLNIDQGGYDDGGAYWGIGEPIYCATDGADYFETIRASNRDHAAMLLNIEQVQLKMRISNPHWLRWSAIRAYIGLPQSVFEVCEFGKPVGYVEDWPALCCFAQDGSGLHLYQGTPIVTELRRPS